MAEHTPVQLGTPGKHSCQVFRRDTFQVTPEPSVVWNPSQALEQQRIEKLLAKLPMASPEFALPVRTERQHINEDRIGPLELDIEGGGIGKGDTAFQDRQMQIEMQKRRLLERGENPLVRVRNEVETGMFQNSADLIAKFELPYVSLCCLDQPALGYEPGDNTAIFDAEIVLDCPLGNSSNYPPLVLINVARRISKRTGTPKRSTQLLLLLVFRASFRK